MVIGTPVVLNLIPGGVNKVVHVNQVNDNIEIQFQIMNGSQPYNVTEGVSCTIRGTKGDSYGYTAEAATTVGSNVVTVTLTEQLTAVAGGCNVFELVFVGAENSMKVSTENFILAVERAALGEDTVISDSDLAYAEQVLDQLQSVGAVNAQVQQNKANIAAETTRATAAEQTLQQHINSETSARQSADNTLQSNINAEASTRATQDASLQSQINQLIAPSGSAPSAAEVENARVGADGTTYPTLGDAIRTQVTDVKTALEAIDGVVGLYKKSGTATQAVRYTETIAVSAITFEPFTKYIVTLTTPTALSTVIYGYVKNDNDETLFACNISANETSATYVFYTATRLENCKVVFQSGVNNTTVSAFVAKDVSVYDDLSAYEQTINFTTTSGYFRTDGTISSATTDQEVYTDAINVEQLSAIRFALIYPGLIGSVVLWLKAGVTYKNGTFERKDITTNIGDFIVTDDMEKVAFTYRTYGDCSFKAVAIGLKNANVSVKIAEYDNAIETATRKAINASIYSNPFEFLPCWDHLFVSRSGTWVTIPHESLFHVRLSRLFGAKVIEANLWRTSDGVFVVNHLSGGKFGNYFHHVDNSTDISNISVSSVTWEWIANNVRYNSRIAKYQTRPPRLEEFLAECKQQNLIPLVTASDADAVAIVRAYMGNGYIAYDGNRNTSPGAIIFEWKSYNTKEEILAYCESIGKPMIYGFGNITDFTDAELFEIINMLHDNGYLTACSYTYDKWAHYASLGIDANGAIQQINRLTNGNICNLESLYGFNHFVHTNATETDGVLTFTADGTIAPDIANDTLDVCAVDIELVFDGSITIPSFGEHVNATTITGDGVHPYFQATPILGGSPKVTITVASGTKIYDMKYKATQI